MKSWRSRDLPQVSNASRGLRSARKFPEGMPNAPPAAKGRQGGKNRTGKDPNISFASRHYCALRYGYSEGTSPLGSNWGLSELSGVAEPQNSRFWMTPLEQGISRGAEDANA